MEDGIKEISLLDDDFGLESSTILGISLLDAYSEPLQKALNLFLDSLDEWQSNILLFDNESPVKCTANAGSGKTRILVARALKMIVQDRISASEIVLITFTNKAAREIRERVEKFFSDIMTPEDFQKLTLPNVSTIHSFGFRLLLRDIALRRSILSEYSSQKLLRSIFLEYLEFERVEMKDVVRAHKVIQALYANNEMHHICTPILSNTGELSFIADWSDISQRADLLPAWRNLEKSSFTYLMRNIEDPNWQIVFHLNESILEHYSAEAGLTPKEFQRLVREFFRIKYTAGTFDFADMLYFPVLYFSQHPEKLVTTRAMLKYFSVDEAQDIDIIQYALVQLIAGDASRVLYVGDTKQTLFRWRNAVPEILENLEKLTPVPLLEGNLLANYRSTKQLVILSNHIASSFQFIRAEPSEPIRELASKTFSHMGFEDSYSEIRHVAKEIRAAGANGTPYKDVAIIARTNKSLSDLEAAMISERIPYILKYDNRSAVRQSTFRFLYCLYSILLNPRDVVAFSEMLWSIKGFGGKFIESVQREILYKLSDSKTFTVFEISSSPDVFDSPRSKQYQTLYAWMDRVILPIVKLYRENDFTFQGMNYEIMAKVREQCSFEGDADYKSFHLQFELQQLWKSIQTLENVYIVMAEDTEFYYKSNLEQFEELYQALLLSQDTSDDKENAVTLSTIHAAKGREWNTVYGVQLNRLVPFGGEEFEDERCAFYVMCTRAKDRLVLTGSRRALTYAGQLRATFPNPFLDEYLVGVEKLRADLISNSA
ncbi:MAG TPA: ATP-dependent helicase [bacterium]|nr:ATP-dependent helicase [bacterium]